MFPMLVPGSYSRMAESLVSWLRQEVRSACEAVNLSQEMSWIFGSSTSSSRNPPPTTAATPTGTRPASTTASLTPPSSPSMLTSSSPRRAYRPVCRSRVISRCAAHSSSFGQATSTRQIRVVRTTCMVDRAAGARGDLQKVCYTHQSSRLVVMSPTYHPDGCIFHGVPYRLLSSMVPLMTIHDPPPYPFVVVGTSTHSTATRNTGK